jgi:hypothetical protein
MNSDLRYILVDKTKVPNIPFLWYREQQILMPIDDINYDDILGIYIVKQRHVIKDANIYVCLHGLMYGLFRNDDVIESNFNLSKRFKTNSDKIKISGNTGTVHIHDMAFSPCGSHFIACSDHNNQNLQFDVEIESDEINSNENTFRYQIRFIVEADL